MTDKAKLHTGDRLPALSPPQSEYTTSRGSKGVQHFRVYRLPQPAGEAFLLAAGSDGYVPERHCSSPVHSAHDKPVPGFWPSRFRVFREQLRPTDGEQGRIGSDFGRM